MEPCPLHRSSPLSARLFVVLTVCSALLVLAGLPLLEAEETIRDYRDADDGDMGATTEKDNATDGQFLGSACVDTCDPRLPNVFCDLVTRHCECDKKYPVKLGPTRGCAKPVRLGDQCFYGQTCTFTDQNAICMQIHHNAICQCKAGYHSVAVARPTKRVFCSEDLVLLTTDVPTLFGVATGIALFTGLICFVLKLFSSARYTRPRHYANAGLAPPILFASDTGMPLAVHQQGGCRPGSRSSQRSCGTLASGYSRRASSGGSRGVLVPASRAGAARTAAILLISCHLTTTNTNTNNNTQLQTESDEQPPTSPVTGSRRPSLASVHSSASSTRSYSMRRYEREHQQRELRQQQIQDSLRLSAGCVDREVVAPMPSPKTPMSTDELLPSVSEGEEGCSSAVSGPSHAPATNASYQGEIGPCSSSTEHV